MPTDAELPSLPIGAVMDLRREIGARALNLLAAQTPEQQASADALLGPAAYMPALLASYGLQFVSCGADPDDPFGILVHVAGYRPVSFTFNDLKTRGV